MKTIKHILTLTLIATFAFSCKNEKNPEVKTVEIETEVVKELDKCNICKNGIHH